MLGRGRGVAVAVFEAAVTAAEEAGKEGFGPGAAKGSSAVTGGKGVFDASGTCSASGLEAALSAAPASMRACSRLAHRRILEGVDFLGRW